jgi:glycosyltransferase involved in cell wall biosynthesis
MATISVVIPSLNDAILLRECLRAVFAQSRLADEVIVVDNGSTDDTAEVARTAGARVVDQPLRGVFPATAAGFDAASGDIIARLDADSVAPPDWIERVEATFAASPGLAALTGPGDFYGSNAAIHWVAKRLYIGGYVWFIGGMLGHPPLFGSNLALRASTWERMRLTVHSDNPVVHDDLDLSFAVRPDMTTVFDESLRVGVSARPFESWAGLRSRVSRAYTTVAINWREESPVRRRAARKSWREQNADDQLVAEA